MAFWKKDKTSAEWLADVAFFAGFTDDELARVAQLGDEVEAVRGAEITDQGRVGQVCYVIVEGSASVYYADEHVATLEAGSMVGEMALIDHRPRSATVISDTPMKLLAFEIKAFGQLLSEFPRARERVMALLSERTRARG